MKAIKQFNRFLKKANDDSRLLPSHISLYFAILSSWSESKFAQTFRIFRKDLMRLSHISSFATYHKCMKQLDEYGYLKYESSYNYYQGCLIELLC